MGFAFERDGKAGTIKISQITLIDTIFERYNVTLRYPIPAFQSEILRPTEDGEEEIVCPYLKAVGALVWLASITRPDISNAVREVTRHNHNPSDQHRTVVRQILGYLSGTRTYGLLRE